MEIKFIGVSILWGLLIWLIGYIFGIILFFIVPHSLIGWIILPIGTVISVLVLLKKIKTNSLLNYLIVALVWVWIAILFDYIFIVILLKSGKAYYTLDVSIYYIMMFFIPLFIGWYKKVKRG